ncbi:Na+/H+ antiporter NhaC family protein [Agarivorans sp. 1_MG-2023]|uniref:Na+/H+ antiporter NhaC family protein n=1 Tax=Agarivorans sp. 1_MG-2023 TaxID=3062634 RepID=UPI0026E3F97B|nr:Na+/H+ antiporter NhaC family protein [Agarivorans sp. 1_MG-2023]MDO6763973.1 Na+/H+ antiporter NhaC family protein [Agarivorans sp. 1_MG-2023]
MQTISYTDSILSILPPVIALLVALATRRVVVALSCGILAGALLLSNFSFGASAVYLTELASGLVWDDGLNLWNLQIILFLLLLGGMTSLMTATGATSAFAHWAQKRIQTKRHATVTTALLSFVVFVDDYFHSLAVGSVARPLTDQAGVSRAKLAYLLDSTAAPMCVLMPLSSWGAYIIALIGGILVTHGITDISPLAAFAAMIPLNFYAIFALLMALTVAYFNLNIGPMTQHEKAASDGELFDKTKGIPAGSVNHDFQAENGSPLGLVLPIVLLTVVTFASFVVTGANAIEDGQAFGLLAALENTDVTLSLVTGGIVGLLVTIGFALKQQLSLTQLSNAIWLGLKAMSPAIIILLFAWSISGVIGDMETGKYLAAKLDGAINPAMLPVLIFVLAGVMAFATGTSWGTFGIMLPIAADMAVASEVSLILPMLSAVLAGAVFGDHCSPISDTTILSSTGAACHHIDHVATQLPYALLVAFISIASYLVMGMSGSVIAALAIGLLLFAIISAALYHRQQTSVIAVNS